MNLKEFAQQNPELIKKASKCNSKEELAKFAKEHGVEIPNEMLDDAYSYVRAQAVGELNEDAMEGIAGGTKYKSGQIVEGTAYVQSGTNLKGQGITHLK